MYCTVEDLWKTIPEETLIQLTDDDGNEEISQEHVDNAIEAADAEIDAYCGTRYALPFAAVPEIVKKCSTDIAIYNLYARRFEEIPSARTERYRNAVRQLELIAKGAISLGVAETPAPSPEASGAECNKPTPDRVFTRTKLGGF